MEPDTKSMVTTWRHGEIGYNSPGPEQEPSQPLFRNTAALPYTSDHVCTHTGLTEETDYEFTTVNGSHFLVWPRKEQTLEKIVICPGHACFIWGDEQLHRVQHSHNGCSVPGDVPWSPFQDDLLPSCKESGWETSSNSYSFRADFNFFLYRMFLFTASVLSLLFILKNTLHPKLLPEVCL